MVMLRGPVRELCQAANQAHVATVVGRVEGEDGWEIIDRVSAVHAGGPYPRGEQRIVFLVAPEHVTTTAY